MRPLLWAAAALLAAPAATAAPESYAIDPTHSVVHFELRLHGVSTLRGRLGRTQGTITLDREAREGRADVTVDTAALSTGHAAVDAALQAGAGPDAAARFVATAFRVDGDTVAALDGQLTLRGRTLPLALRALRSDCYLNPLFRRQVCGGDFEGTITRGAFGIAGTSPELGDAIRLLVQVEAVRQ